MQENPTQHAGESPDAVEATINMLLVLPDMQRPWSVGELERELGKPEAVANALRGLHGAGLVHRCGDFVWATRAAVAADELAR